MPELRGAAVTDLATSQVSTTGQRDAAWLRAARLARWLSWASLVWMTAEGVLGVCGDP